MGKVRVTFEADSRDELVGDIGEFLNLCTGSPVVETVEPPKPKTRGRKTKKEKEAEEAAASAPADTITIDLGAGPTTPPAELPTPTHPELVEALTALQTAKGDDVTIQVMQEFGGSTKMMDIPEENYALLFSEVVKATNG